MVFGLSSIIKALPPDSLLCLSTVRPCQLQLRDIFPVYRYIDTDLNFLPTPCLCGLVRIKVLSGKSVNREVLNYLSEKSLLTVKIVQSNILLRKIFKSW